MLKIAHQYMKHLLLERGIDAPQVRHSVSLELIEIGIQAKEALEFVEKIYDEMVEEGLFRKALPAAPSDQTIVHGPTESHHHWED